MKTRVHYSQTADVCSTITSTTTWTNKPRTTSASQVHQTMDMYNQHITNISYQTTKLTTKSASQEYWTSTTPIRTTDSTSTTIKTTMRRTGVTKLQPNNLFWWWQPVQVITQISIISPHQYKHYAYAFKPTLSWHLCAINYFNFQIVTILHCNISADICTHIR